MPTKIIGSAPYQAPRNSDLGALAVQDADSVNIQGGAITLGFSPTQGYFQNTDVSDVKPTLNLDFANGKTLDPRITYSRASTATYYDGKSYALAEQNLLYASNMFSLWANSVGVTYGYGAAIAPDGTATATSITGTAGAYQNYVQQLTLPTMGSIGTFSVYLKAGSISTVRLYFYANNTVTADFNLSAGTVSTPQASSGTYVSSAITSVGNGWYRCSVTGYPTGNQSGTYCVIYADAGTFYAWGAQYELRSSATAYVPTPNVASISSTVTNYIPQLVTAPAGVPRFDHDPITGESKGLVIEESRTNLLPYSNPSSFNNPFNVSVTQNAIVAPDGTVTGQKLIPSSSGGDHYMQANNVAAGAIGSQYTASIYAKAGEMQCIGLEIFIGGVDGIVAFNLVSGTITFAQSGFSGSITPVGNGWYRLTTTSPVTTTSAIGGIVLRAFNTYPSYTAAGDGYSGAYVWGAQLENSAFATSYIPTSGSSATRAFDDARITGTNFTSWYRADEGTLYAEAAPNIQTPVSSGVMSVYSQVATANETLSMYYIPNGGIDMEILASSQIQSTFVLPRTTTNAGTRAAMAWKLNDNNAAANGTVSTADTSCVAPNTVSALQIGGIYGSGSYVCNGTIKKIAFYPKRLSNAELAEITL